VKHFLLGVLFALLALFLGGFAYLRLGFAEVRGMAHYGELVEPCR
jgi:hypothetical protein